MKLLRLVINNLFCFKSVDINFAKFGAGIILIEGINENDPNKANSTGKTYLMEVINWVLFDDIIKGDVLKNKNKIIRDGEKSGDVTLTFQLNNDIIQIKKARKIDKTYIDVFVNDKGK